MTKSVSPDDRLGDFTADGRLFYYHAIDSRLVSPADNRLGLWALLVPASR